MGIMAAVQSLQAVQPGVTVYTAAWMQQQPARSQGMLMLLHLLAFLSARINGQQNSTT
jgi:hypothetical protein